MVADNGEAGDPTLVVATSALPEAWVLYIAPFAVAIGKSVEDVTKAFADLVGEPNDEAISLLKDGNFTPDADIVAAIGAGVPKAKLTKAIVGLREVKVAADATGASMAPITFDILPKVPTDDQLLEILKIGGVLKIGPATVTAAVGAALAARVGLFDLPEKILEAMERRTDALGESAPDEYYALETLLTRRNNSAIFAAMPNVDGRKYASQKRKDALITKLNTHLWGAFAGFHTQVKAWMDQYLVQATTIGQINMANAFQALASGTGSMGPGAAGMMAAMPPTDPVRDAAEAVIDSINTVFSGTGIPTTLALSSDAQQIRKVLENSSLPGFIGAGNREEMLRMLGAAVTSDYPRLETNLKQYALAIIELKNVTSGQPEYAYIAALHALGGQIQFERLGVGNSPAKTAAPTGIGRTTPTTNSRRGPDDFGGPTSSKL